MSEFPPATLETLWQDGKSRVTRWTFRSGEATGMHIHEHDYIAVPVSGGDFTAHFPDGTTADVIQVAGEPYARQAGVHHNVHFTGEGQAQFVEIEFLGG